MDCRPRPPRSTFTTSLVGCRSACSTPTRRRSTRPSTCSRDRAAPGDRRRRRRDHVPMPADEVRALAEAWQIPVVTTWNGKSAFPEDHDLFAGSVGQTGTIRGNTSPPTPTSWSRSAAGSPTGPPPATPRESVVLVSARQAHPHRHRPARDRQELSGRGGHPRRRQAGRRRDRRFASGRNRRPVRVPRRSSSELQGRLGGQASHAAATPTASRSHSQRPLGALRRVMDRDGIIVAGSGNTQGAVKQTFPVYEPRTHLTSGGFSSMGWAVPAAIGRQARPRPTGRWRASSVTATS